MEQAPESLGMVLGEVVERHPQRRCPPSDRLVDGERIDSHPDLTFSLRTQRLTHGTLVEGVADGAWRA
jgi:hypothetical protein